MEQQTANRLVDLLAEIVGKIGMTAQDAWPYIVRQMFIRAVLWLVIDAVLIAVATGMFIYLMRLFIKTYKLEEEKREGEVTGALFGIACTVAGGLLVLFLVMTGVQSSLAMVLEPVGGTILRFIGK